MADRAKGRKRKEAERFNPNPKRRQLASEINAIMDMPFYSSEDYNPRDPRPKKNDLILCYWTELEDRLDKDIVVESMSGYYFAKVLETVTAGDPFVSVKFFSTGQKHTLMRGLARQGTRQRILPIYDYIKSQQSEFRECGYVRKEFKKKFKETTKEQRCVWNFVYKYKNRLKRYNRRQKFEGFKMTAKESKGDMDVARALLDLKEKAASSDSDSDSETESEEEKMYDDFLDDKYVVMLRKLKF